MTSHDTGSPVGDDGVVDIESDAAADVFDALSSTTARDVLAALYEDAMTASALADAVDTSLQNASHHLDQLRSACLIEVVDTDVSAQGREMKRYGPTADALVLRAGADWPAPPGASAPASSGDAAVTQRDPDPTATGASCGGRLRAFLGGVAVALVFVALARVLRGD